MFTQLRHPPHSPDLAPSDFFSFKNFKKERKTRFASDVELKEAAEEHFAGLPKELFFEDMGQFGILMYRISAPRIKINNSAI